MPLVVSRVSRTRPRSASVRRNRRGRCTGKRHACLAAGCSSALIIACDGVGQARRRCVVRFDRDARARFAQCARGGRADRGELHLRCEISASSAGGTHRGKIMKCRWAGEDDRIHFSAAHALDSISGSSVFGAQRAIGHYFGHARARFAQCRRQAIVRAVAARQQHSLAAMDSRKLARRAIRLCDFSPRNPPLIPSVPMRRAVAMPTAALRARSEPSAARRARSPPAAAEESYRILAGEKYPVEAGEARERSIELGGSSGGAKLTVGISSTSAPSVSSARINSRLVRARESRRCACQRAACRARFLRCPTDLPARRRSRSAPASIKFFGRPARPSASASAAGPLCRAAQQFRAVGRKHARVEDNRLVFKSRPGSQRHLAAAFKLAQQRAFGRRRKHVSPHRRAARAICVVAIVAARFDSQRALPHRGKHHLRRKNSVMRRRKPKPVTPATASTMASNSPRRHFRCACPHCRAGPALQVRARRAAAAPGAAGCWCRCARHAATLPGCRVRGNQAIARIFALGDWRETEPVGSFRGNILHAVHREIDAPGQQRVLEFLDEHALRRRF